ncbi:MAG: dTDP-4-dehydrorhamnose reductase [bacterium]|nr:dTDP-4-dehydrorhamnose reductase [bacterium]
MTTLVLGGSGQLGSAFRVLLPDALAPTRVELDLADLEGIAKKVTEFAPTTIINCAAYTAVDEAEGDEETARLINGDAVGKLALVAAHLGVPFVTFSTDYVFDGAADDAYTESSDPNPLNAYGRSKLLGERLALPHPGSLVVRTSWLLSATHPNFVTTILGRAADGAVDVVDDQWGRPTMADDLARAALDAVDQGVRGLLHLASPPTTTWCGLAREAYKIAGIDAVRIRPCSTERFPRPAQRPQRSVLESERAVNMPEWRPGLVRWLAGGW